MPEPALLYTLNNKIKSITVNENKACIGNDSLTIVGCRSYHMVGSLESCLKVLGSYPMVRGLGSCLRVQDLGSCPKVLRLGSSSRIRGPGSCPMVLCLESYPRVCDPRSCLRVRGPIFLVCQNS